MGKYIFLLIAYLVGSIPFSYLLGKYIKKDDIRNKGSGNLGASNAFRVFGTIIGILVMILDTLKSGLFVLAVKEGWLGPDLFHPVIYGAIAVFGHIYPVWMKFKGGKGVASSFGLLAFYFWPLPIALLPVFIITIVTTRIASIASTAVTILAFLGTILFYILNVNGYTYFQDFDLTFLITVSLLTTLILFKHRHNYIRIIKGTENKVVFKKKKA
jgi:glycerol-3-phosphate acyltransferase PlsY